MQPLAKAHWLGTRQMRWRSCDSERMRPLWRRREPGEALERDVLGNGLPRCTGLGAWVKRKSRTAERLAKRAPDITRAQYRGSGFRCELGPYGQVDAETVDSQPGSAVWACRFACFEPSYGFSTSPVPAISTPAAAEPLA